MKEKEDIVFKKSLKALKKYRDNFFKFGSGIEDNIYEFQIFVEFLLRYKKELKISDKNADLIAESFDEISLSFKFLCSGYYLTSGMHLRRFVEKNINWLNLHKTNPGKKGTARKLKEIFEHGEVGYLQEVLPEGYVSDRILYDGVFVYLSENFTHNGSSDIDLHFDQEKFEEGILTIFLCIMLTARMINIALGDTMEPYINNKIESPVIWDEKPWYFTYIQHLCGHGMFSFPETLLYNFIHDSKIGKRLILEKMGFTLEELFSKEYLEDHKI